MRIIYILLTVGATLFTILIIGLTILSIASGGGSILFPGLGLVVSLPLIIMLLATIDAVIIFLALLFRQMSRRQKIS